MTSEALDEQTRAEWRALGFFYDYTEATRTWSIRASRSGFARLSYELRCYARDARNRQVSEREHYGPYSSLKFVTWPEPKISSDGFYGRLEDFEELAALVDGAIRHARPGDRIRLEQAYSEASDAKLELIVEDDGFDPASASS